MAGIFDATAFQPANKDRVAKKTKAGLAMNVNDDKKTVVKASLSRPKSSAEGIVGRNDRRAAGKTEVGI